MMERSPEEYCDLVMKGGITSGVVYPSAVLALSKRYRFKNIGGTSAGAISASVTAAAVLGDRRRNLAGATAEGLEGLARVSGQLGQSGLILSLFQPARGNGALFRLLLKVSGKGRPAANTFWIIISVLLIAPVETILAAVALLGLGSLIDGWSGVAAAALPATVCAILIGAAAAVFRSAGAIKRASFGLCPGTRQGGRRTTAPALSEWLHSALQQVSGQQDRPLLFQDLWDAPRYPDEPGERAISLEMITTGISHREPRSLPFDNSTFWFRADELAQLIPAEVVDWLVQQDPMPVNAGGVTYYRLPEAGRLPVILAARMSLSFPILLSAVPLYEPDWSSVKKNEGREAGSGTSRHADALEATEALTTGGLRTKEPPRAFRKCWFSDGGISSNFPLHMFDAPLPRWPTFAIDLVYPRLVPGGDAPAVFLPTENNRGWQRRFEPIEGETAFGEVLGFLFSIVGTMQNWRDILQSRAPGYRDRIVRIPLASDEGGMNLNMTKAVLDRIALKGAEAGEMLVNDFDFANHWWIRWRGVASATERFTIGVGRAVQAPPTASYEMARSSALEGEPRPPSYPFTGSQISDAPERLRNMVEQGLLWDDTDPGLSKGAPRPLPQMRIVPTF